MNANVNQLIADLYRGSRDVPYPAFQEWALQQLRGAVAFDAAWWGRGANKPLMIHQVHLHRCAPTLVEDYAPWIGVDFFREAVCANPGVTISTASLRSRPDLEASTIYREFGAKHRVEWSLGTVLIEPVSSLNEFITVWRKDVRRPFSEADRTTKELLMPHLVEAYRNCRLLHLHEASQRDHSLSWALCNPQGILIDVHRRFVSLMITEWTNWHSAELPAALSKQVIECKEFVGRKIAVKTTPLSGLYCLQARPRSAVDMLSNREREVANHYAQGQTYAEISVMLGLAPATVRNLISRAFRKLDVNNKAELALRLRA
jgi:DNA-binding CsgD family transcriptional regulator